MDTGTGGWLAAGDAVVFASSDAHPVLDIMNVNIAKVADIDRSVFFLISFLP